MPTILDGAIGTELSARGIPVPAPLWSALALDIAPDVVASIHRAYAEAGATVHTANTFRTKRRSAGPRWEELAYKAVAIARSSIPAGHLVAGSVAPLEDCYRPDLSPVDARPEHRELCRCLADAGVDLLLCETFPHLGEARIAAEEALATGLPTWVAFTAGPSADLLSPAEIAAGAREVAALGAHVVLVNCTKASRMSPYVDALVGLKIPFGVYANAGDPDEGFGWTDDPEAPRRYAALVETWIRRGAAIVGGCCGTGPAHIRAIAESVSRMR